MGKEKDMKEDTVCKLLESVTKGDEARTELDRVVNDIWNHICIISKPFEFEAQKKFPYARLNPYENTFGAVHVWNYLSQEDEIELTLNDNCSRDIDSFTVRIPTYWLWVGREVIALCVQEAWEKAVYDQMAKSSMKEDEAKEHRRQQYEKLKKEFE
jgi:hypothetical protein